MTARSAAVEAFRRFPCTPILKESDHWAREHDRKRHGCRVRPVRSHILLKISCWSLLRFFTFYAEHVHRRDLPRLGRGTGLELPVTKNSLISNMTVFLAR